MSITVGKPESSAPVKKIPAQQLDPTRNCNLIIVREISGRQQLLRVEKVDTVSDGRVRIQAHYVRDRGPCALYISPDELVELF